jgi:two-component system sensor histidine kinase DesK
MDTPDESAVGERLYMSPRARQFILVWSGLWLAAVLASAAVDYAETHPAPTRVVAASAAALAFAVMYEIATWVVMSERDVWAGRPWMWAAILGAGAVGLIVAFGGEFIGAFLFVAVMSAMTLPERRGRLAVAAVTLATLAAGLRSGIDSSKTWALVITVFMVGIAMTWVRRMSDLIHELRRAREQVARMAVNEERSGSPETSPTSWGTPFPRSRSRPRWPGDWSGEIRRGPSESCRRSRR